MPLIPAALRALQPGRLVALGLVGAVFCLAPKSNAQSGLDWSQPVTPGECVRLALARNLDLAIAETDMERARGGAKQAWAGILPRLSASANLLHEDRTSQGVRISQGVGVPTQGESETDVRSTNLSLEQSLFDWSNWQNLKSAKKGAAAATHDVENTVLEVVLETRVRFYELLKAKRLHEVREEAVELRGQQHERAETLFEVGSVAKNDVLQARVNEQQAKLEEIQARNLVAVERGRLAQLLGLRPTARFDIVDELTIAQPTQIDSVALWEQARRLRPDLKAARLRLDASLAGLSAARGRRFPSLFARATQSWSDVLAAPGDPLLPRPESRSWDVSGGINWNLFDGLATEGQVKEAAALARQAEEQLRRAELAAELEFTEALLGLREARSSIVAAEEAVGLAAENTKLAEERYQLGSGTLLELEEAQVGLIDARRALVEAQAAFKVAEAQLEKARGVPPRT